MAGDSSAKVPKTKLPGTDIEVSVLALGTWQFGDPTQTYEKKPAEVERDIVKAAFDAGINFIDTAEGYGAGEAERAVAAALKAAGIDRKDVVIASKVNPNNLTYDALKEACERSLKNLDTDYIDLYQIHWPNHELPVADAAKALEELHAEGKIRAIGVSNFGPKDMADIRGTGLPVVTNQLPYSLLWRVIEHEVIPSTAPTAGVLAYSPLQQGLLTGKYSKTEDCGEGLARSRLFDKARSSKCRHSESGAEKELWDFVAKLREVSERIGKSMSHCAISWILQQPGVTAALFGVSKPEQIARNAAAALDPIPPEVVAELTAASEPVKAKMGTNCDLWDDKDGGRYR